jgi:hypothetical protein
VDDKALLGNDSVKEQWNRSDRYYAMTQYTHVNNGGEDVFCVVGAVVTWRVWSQLQNSKYSSGVTTVVTAVVPTEMSASLVRASMKLEEKWMQWVSDAARSTQTG